MRKLCGMTGCGCGVSSSGSVPGALPKGAGRLRTSRKIQRASAQDVALTRQMAGFLRFAAVQQISRRTVPSSANHVLTFGNIQDIPARQHSRRSVSQSVKSGICDGCVDFFQQENLGGNNCLTIAKTRHIFDLSSVGRRRHDYSERHGVRFGNVVSDRRIVTGKFVNTSRTVTFRRSAEVCRTVNQQERFSYRIE